jgi:hypothetical protein
MTVSLGQRAVEAYIKQAGDNIRLQAVRRMYDNLNRMAAAGNVKLDRRMFMASQLAGAIAPTHGALAALEKPQVAATAKMLARGAGLAGTAITHPVVGPQIASALPNSRFTKLPRYLGYAAAVPPVAYALARGLQSASGNDK